MLRERKETEPRAWIAELNKIAAAESLLVEWRPKFPQNQALRRGPVSILYTKGDLPAYRLAVDSARTKGDSLDKRWAKQRAADLALLDGKFREFSRAWYELFPVDVKDPRQRLGDVVNLPYQFRTEFFGETERASILKDLDGAIAAVQARDGASAEWPWFDLVTTFSFLNRPDRARVWLARYDAEVKDTVRRRLDTPVRQRVEAHVLLAEAKTAEAIVLYRKADRLPDGFRNTCTSCLPINLAFAFSKAGEADSTIFYATQALTIYDPNRVADYQDQFIQPLLYQILGELYEKKGDRVKAAEYYRKLMDQWKNADPELQVIVEELKRRVRRLSDNEGTRQ
jgi:tetratricopeptide (TPR) repeat protein